MKLIKLILFLFLSSQMFGQNIVKEGDEYIDTATDQNLKCKNRTLFFYQVGGKYPKNSATLLEEFVLFLQNKEQVNTGSGNITFRFTVDCEGQVMKKIQVLQTDEKYKPYSFKKELISQLFLFFKTLKNWKVIKLNNVEPVNYFAFITFKIKNGKVINIIP
jgi:hypothetical protein